MVVMALGFVSRPAYLSPQFFESKALKLIIGKSKTNRTAEILPEHFNDDKLGRVLDEIYDLGPDMLFQSIAFAAARKEKLTVPTLHHDTTSFSFYGDYTSEASTGAKSGEFPAEPCHAIITYGFSKDHRADCKQLVQELLVSSDGDVPLMAKIHSGNASDVKIFQERTKDLKRQFAEATDLMPEYIVADSKFYNEKNIQFCKDQENGPRWITRVPDNIIEAKAAIENAFMNNNWNTFESGQGADANRYSASVVTRKGVAQRFIVVVTAYGLIRANKTVQRQSEKELETLLKKEKSLLKKKFFSKLEAEEYINQISKSLIYHKIDSFEIAAHQKYLKKGRPSVTDAVIDTYSASFLLSKLNEDEINKIVWNKASFVVGTSDLVAGAEKIIKIYRKDQQGVERAFRFLKSPMFFADAFFFKNTKRIVALLTLMTISLLVYSLLQRKLRLAIEEKNEPIPDQKGKPTKRPTMAWVSQSFEGIDLISHSYKGVREYKFVRLGKFANQVLALLGSQYVDRYSSKMLI